MILVGLGNSHALAGLSIEQERKMGEEFLKAALRYLRFVEDPEVVDYVNKVGQSIVGHLEVHAFPYHFYVVDSSALNAFAAPAGHVFINRGLLEIMDHEGELAAVLAHEIAHVQSRHIAERLARSQKLNLASLGGMLAGVFLGGAVGQALTTGTAAMATSTELTYTRQNEEEADRKGLRYLEASGYPGDDIVSIFKKMGQHSWQAGGRAPTYLSTHPGVSERVNYLATTLETRHAAGGHTVEPAKQTQEFCFMEAKLLGAYGDPSEAMARFLEWRGRQETQVMALYGMGLLQRRQGKMEEALQSLKAAVSLRPDLAPLLVELGETYFQMGQLDKAISVLESAVSAEADQPTTLYALGRFLLERGDAVTA